MLGPYHVRHVSLCHSWPTSSMTSGYITNVVLSMLIIEVLHEKQQTKTKLNPNEKLQLKVRCAVSDPSCYTGLWQLQEVRHSTGSPKCFVRGSSLVTSWLYIKLCNRNETALVARNIEETLALCEENRRPFSVRSTASRMCSVAKNMVSKRAVLFVCFGEKTSLDTSTRSIDFQFCFDSFSLSLS